MPLPPGLVLNRSTGEIAGTPTKEGFYEFTLLLRDAIGTEREIPDDITIFPYIAMSAAPIPLFGTLGQAYSYTPDVQDGVSPYLYSILSGTLPPGLSFTAGTGVISGTPDTVGDYLFTYRVTDSKLQNLDRAAIVAVRDLPDLSGTPPAMSVGSSFTWTVTVTGGHAPFVFDIAGTPLPTGLGFNIDTGTISGVPTQAGTFASIILAVTDAAGNADFHNITLNSYAPPSLSGTMTAIGTTGSAYSSGFTLTGGAPPVIWSHLGTLPPGLSVNSSNGVVSGTPTTPGSYNFTIQATDALLKFATRNGTIAVTLPVSLSGTLPNGQINIAYSAGLNVSGGAPPYSWSISSGSLPPGFSISPSTGVVSGTSGTANTYNFTVRAQDSAGRFGTSAQSVIIAGALSISNSLTATGTTTLAYSSTLTAIGGTTPYTWTFVSGSLPPGLTFSNGTLTGTPTSAGTYNFTVRVTDALGAFVNKANTVTVAVYPALSGTLPDATQNVAYNQTYTITGGHLPRSFTISAGSLPTGLSINASTGAITGTPSATGGFTFTVRLQDNIGNIATRNGTVTIFAPLQLSSNYPTTAYQGLSYNGTAPTRTGGKLPVAYVVSGGSLPPGLTLSASTGAITGTPTTTGSYNFSVRGTDALASQATINVTVNVVQVPSISNLGAAPKATAGVAYSFTLLGQGGVAPYTFSGTLSKGLSLASNGAITGNPTHSGTTTTVNYQVTITDNIGQQNTQTLSITFAQMPTINVPASLKATRGVAFSASYSGNFGHTPYTFTVASGSLPSGLSLSGGGVITGTTTATAGTYPFVVRLTDAAGNIVNTATQDLVLVNAMSLSGTYPRGTAGTAYSSTAVTRSGGHTPFTWAVVSGGLPPGLTLNTSTGALTGTPTSAGTYNFTVRVTDSTAQTVQSALSVQIAGTLTLSGTLANGQVGSAYGSGFSRSGGWSPYSWSISAGSLPTGLSISSSTGAIFGTPSVANTFNFTVRVQDADGNVATRAASVTINPVPPTLSVTINPSPAIGEYSGYGEQANIETSAVASATGASGPVTWTWTKISGADLTVTGTGAVRTFSSVMPGPGGGVFHKEAVWRAQANDGTNTAHADVTVILDYIDLR